MLRRQCLFNIVMLNMFKRVEMMMDLISIIVPVYNSEKRLKKCLDSIINQTYKNLEIILVNDGSRDASLSICKNYKNIDNRIIVIDTQNKGVSSARNTGLEYASGDYIGFVDSDDTIHPKLYQTMFNYIKKDKAELCVLGSYVINTKGLNSDLEGNIINNIEGLKKLCLLQFPTSVWAYLYSEKIIRNSFFNTNIHFFEDFLFNYSAIQNSNEISICFEGTYNYEINENSVNSQEINDRKMTSLNVYDYLEDDFKKNNILDYAQYFRAHFIIAIILSIAKSTGTYMNYSKLTKDKARTGFNDLLKSKYVPSVYKCIILLYVLFPKVTTCIVRFYLKNRVK